MPGIEETMGGNSQSYISMEVNDNVNCDEVNANHDEGNVNHDDDNETLEIESGQLPQSSDPCIQDVEQEDHTSKNLKKKRESKKALLAKRSCPARLSKEIPFKRFKEESMFEHPQTVPDTFKLLKTDKTSVTVEPSQESEEMDLEEFDQELKLPVRRRFFYKSSKSINKYWQSVERYCRPITKSDIKFIQQLITKQEHAESMPMNYNIPPLGEHYTVRWATKDLSDEQMASNPNKPRHRGAVPSPSHALNLLKKGNDDLICLSSGSETHPLQMFLTQNLNKILEEDKEKESSEKFGLDSNEVEVDSDSHDDSLFPPKISKENNEMLYCVARPQETANLPLESRLKRDLEGIGVTCHDDHMREDDEIVMEMKRCMAQMNALGTNNIIQLKRCLKLAEDEMKKQELRQKLRLCDSEILAIHQKIQTSKLKKSTPIKRDRDLAWKLLKNREALIKELDSFRCQD